MKNLLTLIAATVVITSSLLLGISTEPAVASGGLAFYTYQAPFGAATAGSRVIALTFDDGPGPYTPQVLSVLQRYHVAGTFFEIGRNVAQDPSLAKQVVRAGYPVENHTWSHPDLTTIPSSQFGYQIDQTQNEIRSVTGTTPTCVRPPYDSVNGNVINQISQRGLTTMSYSVDPKDWTLPGVSTITSRVIGAAFPGAVVDMHDGGGVRSQTVAALPAIITGLEARGYSFVTVCASSTQFGPQTSDVHSFGTAPTAGQPVLSSVPYAGLAIAGQGGGYWLAAQDGGVFSFSGAPFFGSMGATSLEAPIVGIASTPDGRGYWEVGSDGGIFAFGDAQFFGSMGATSLQSPIVGIASTPDGRGYWEVGSDGGIFAFGDAPFYGSMGSTQNPNPFVGIASGPNGGGYWELASDGGVYSFGDAPFYGSMGGKSGASQYFAISSAPAGNGFILAGQHP